MRDFGVSFKPLEDDKNLPVGSTKSSGHLIFGVKMDFNQKSRWVKDEYLTPYPRNSNKGKHSYYLDTYCPSFDASKGRRYSEPVSSISNI